MMHNSNTRFNNFMEESKKQPIVVPGAASAAIKSSNITLGSQKVSKLFINLTYLYRTLHLDHVSLQITDVTLIGCRPKPSSGTKH